jgi:hypothetical protein
MPRADVYVDLDGREICLGHLDAEEQKLLARIRRRARTHPDWNDFDNYWTREVIKFYGGRGLPLALAREGAVVRVALDLSGRIGVASGVARLGDWRDDLEDVVRDQFPSRKAFCEATGISEDMLSHVLAGRKDLSLASLTKAMERIGYALHIRKLPDLRPAIATRKKRTG